VKYSEIGAILGLRSGDDTPLTPPSPSPYQRIYGLGMCLTFVRVETFIRIFWTFPRNVNFYREKTVDKDRYRNHFNELTEEEQFYVKTNEIYYPKYIILQIHSVTGGEIQESGYLPCLVYYAYL